jgi:hypothetical protein
MAIARSIDLGFDEGSDHVAVAIDVSLVKEAIDNLLDNALKYCPPHSKGDRFHTTASGTHHHHRGYRARDLQANEAVSSSASSAGTMRTPPAPGSGSPSCTRSL